MRWGEATISYKVSEPFKCIVKRAHASDDRTIQESTPALVEGLPLAAKSRRNKTVTTSHEFRSSISVWAARGGHGATTSAGALGAFLRLSVLSHEPGVSRGCGQGTTKTGKPRNPELPTRGSSTGSPMTPTPMSSSSEVRAVRQVYQIDACLVVEGVFWGPLV